MAHHTCDYLIIGNSAAGGTAAEFLSAAAPDKSIIMVSHDIRNILPDATHILQLDQKQVFFGPMDEYLKTEAGKQFLGGADL